jgi:DNA processing protein
MTADAHHDAGRASASGQVSADERAARAVLLRIAEPGDRALAELVAQLGPVDAVERIGSGRPPPGADRWLPRLGGANGGRDLVVAAEVGARLVVPGDDEWPGERLAALKVAPLGLWVRGAHLRASTDRSVSVVGSRASTAYGEHVAADLSAGLADAGWTVLSGGAYGIDGAAHRAVLAVGGTTAAILANGIDGCYPRGHTALLGRIATEGLVITELPPGQQPTRSRFLERNRVIAALSRGTVAVEMALRSGASTTMDRAHDLGRVYMAVPGPVTSPTSAGCHHWIGRRNAQLVTCAADVLALVAPLGEATDPSDQGEVRPTDTLDAESLRLWEALPRAGARPVADLAMAAGLAVREVGARLAVLVSLGLATCDGATAARNIPTR